MSIQPSYGRCKNKNKKGEKSCHVHTAKWWPMYIKLQQQQQKVLSVQPSDGVCMYVYKNKNKKAVMSAQPSDGRCEKEKTSCPVLTIRLVMADVKNKKNKKNVLSIQRPSDAMLSRLSGFSYSQEVWFLLQSRRLTVRTTPTPVPFFI